MDERHLVVGGIILVFLALIVTCGKPHSQGKSATDETTQSQPAPEQWSKWGGIVKENNGDFQFRTNLESGIIEDRQITSVPEPSTLALAGLGGLITLLLATNRKKNL